MVDAPMAAATLDPTTGHQITGLTTNEAAELLRIHGPNELPSEEPRSVRSVALGLLTEPVLLLLFVAATLYFALGELAEGLMLLLFAAFSTSLMLIQEQRSERAVRALRSLAAPMATVMRDGHATAIPARTVVPSDVVVLAEGERVPADAVLISVYDLAVDESLLTGESVPVTKSTDAGADANAVFAGTLVVRGSGYASVTATGFNTEAGKLGASLQQIVSGKTRLQRATDRLVRTFGVLALVVCVGLAAYYGFALDDWLEGTLAGIALGMAMLPEEFPVAFSIFLAIGSWRLAQTGVLIRQTVAVEALGTITCLCVDKTGTITENHMRVSLLDDGANHLDGRSQSAAGAPALRTLIETAALACRPGSHDPMDIAIEEALGDEGRKRRTALQLQREYGIRSALLAVTDVWRRPSGDFVVVMKGAAEHVPLLCRLPPSEIEGIVNRAHELAANGLRVLAVAECSWTGDVLPDDPAEYPFVFRGLIGLEDPVRASVPEAIDRARKAGITVKMITGDYPATALSIARQSGIDGHEAITGTALADASEAEAARLVEQTHVFARVRPEQKLSIVRALQAAGETVAMTGDGVNDAAALKAADVGVAMGRRGTDVAREAADVVLLDDDFSDLIEGVRVGRRLFDNLRKVIIYITAVHVPIAGLAFFPVIFGMPTAIWPIHVVVLEMIIDSMCALTFEGAHGERDLMNRPPRPPSDGVAALPQVLLGLLQGSVVLAAVLLVYAAALDGGATAEVARTLALTAMIVGNLGLVLTNLSQRSTFIAGFSQVPISFVAIAAAALALLTTAILAPQLRQIFQFGLPSIDEVGVATGSALLAVVTIELIKLLPPVSRIAGAK